MDAMRDNVAREIISSEFSYLEKLIFVTQVFLSSLGESHGTLQKYKVPLEDAIKAKDPILDRKEIDLLFGNIETIKDISKRLFSKLNNNSNSHDVIAKVFIDMVRKKESRNDSNFRRLSWICTYLISAILTRDSFQPTLR